MSDEAHISAEQPRPRPSPRLSHAHGNAGRSRRDPGTPRTRPQEAQRLIILTRRADFLAANAGRRVATPGFVLLVRPRADEDNAKRIGFTVTKKIGNAVVRNRMKRRFRELARELLPESGTAGADHVIIGRQGGIERDFSVLRDELIRAFEKANK
jgi:ribonuclease P protein component